MKKKICGILLIATTVFTSCGGPDLSTFDNNVAAQYVADAMLKNDKDYDALKYDHSILTATPTPEATAEPAVTLAPASSEPNDNSQQKNSTSEGATVANGENTGTSKNTVSTAGKKNGTAQAQKTKTSFSSLSGVSGIKVKASSYSVAKSYGTKYAFCSASQGKKLLIVRFNISNTSGTAKKVNLQKSNVKYYARINGKNDVESLYSIVDGDMQYWKGTIAAGAKKKGVLLFEIDKNIKISSVTVSGSKGQNQSDFSVQK